MIFYQIMLPQNCGTARHFIFLITMLAVAMSLSLAPAHCEETSTPFLKFGKQPSSPSYREAIKRWPNVRSCLTKSNAEHNGFSNFAWAKLHRKQDVEVCIFRVFSALGSMGEAINWILNQGYKIEGPYKREIPGDPTAPSQTQYFIADSPISEDRNIPIIKSVPREEFLHSYKSISISSTWVDSSKLRDVHVAFNSL